MWFFFYIIKFVQTIQAAVFYEKNTYEMFKPNLNMFLDFRGSGV